MTATDDPSGERPSLAELENLAGPLTRWLALLEGRQALVRPLLAQMTEATARSQLQPDLRALEADRELLVEALGGVAEGWLGLDAGYAGLSSDLVAAGRVLVRRFDGDLEPDDRTELSQAFDALLGLVSTAQGTHRLLNLAERTLADVLMEGPFTAQRSAVESARQHREAELADLGLLETAIAAVHSRSPGAAKTQTERFHLARDVDDADAALSLWIVATKRVGSASQAFNAVTVSAHLDALDEQGQVDGAVLWQGLDADLPPIAEEMRLASTAALVALHTLDAAIRGLVAGAAGRELAAADRSAVRRLLLGALELGDEYSDLGPELSKVLLATVTVDHPDRLIVFDNLVATGKAFERQGVVLQSWRPLVEGSGLLQD